MKIAKSDVKNVQEAFLAAVEESERKSHVDNIAVLES